LLGLGFRQTSTGRTPFFVGFDLTDGKWVPLSIAGDHLDSTYSIGPIICDDKSHLFAFLYSSTRKLWILFDVDMSGAFKLNINFFA
jgi:hypothetical protein